jgi:aspartate/methionine/tyrosine aminotransferase
VSYTQRIAHLQPEGAYEVLARAQRMERSGVEIIHLEIGQPDFQTFPHISNAGVRAIQSGYTRYNPPAGITTLRERIAEDAGRRRGISIRPEQVLVSPGAKPSLFFPTLALVEPGDEVIIPDPGFPTYAAMIGVAGGVPVPIPLLEERDFSLDLEAFDRALSERTKMIILNSPSNPTGGVLPISDLVHIATGAKKYDCWVMSDEIYARLVYEQGTAPSIASMPDMENRTIVVDGFSKTFSMTGWRLGYSIMPEDLAQRVTLLFTHAYGCTAHFTQYAGYEALRGPQDQVDAMVAAFTRRRDRLVAGLNDIPGVRCRHPKGAFYAFPNVSSTGISSAELAKRLLEDAGVGLLPGTAFGRAGEGYLRLSFANSEENLDKALARMRPVFERLRS